MHDEPNCDAEEPARVRDDIELALAQARRGETLSAEEVFRRLRERLRTDIVAGREALERGEGVSGAEVFRDMRERRKTR
jgi:hypothetical protein